MEIRKRVEDLEGLRGIALDIASGRKREELFNTIGSSVIELMSCDVGGVGLYDKEGNKMWVALAYNMSDKLNGAKFNLDADIFSQALKSRRTWRTDDYQSSPNQIKELAQEGLRAVIAVPLKVREEVIGVLWAAMLKPGRIFNDYDILLLESIGGQAAVAIDNISLFEQQKFISEALQRGFLPELLPELANTDIGVFYASATTEAVVGGDFYDAVEVAHQRMSFFVGDVSGKGVEATSFAAMVKYTLRTVSYEDPEPEHVLTRANPVVARQFPAGHFITLVYGLYDASDGRLLISKAGHPYPLLYSAASRTVNAIGGNDPAFTLIPDYAYNQVELLLSAGDIIVMYTDGIIELRRAGKEFFGEARLSELIAKYAHLSAQAMADRIVEDAKEFANGRLTDDIVLMVIKRT